MRRRDCPGEAWLSLLEKAFAHYCGGYAKLSGGFPFSALEALTGDPVSVFAWDDAKGRWAQLEHDTDVARAAAAPHAPPPRVAAQHEHDAIWALLKDSFAKGHLLAAGTEGVIQSGQEDRQAYAIVELHEINELRLLCVRNPWGSFRWKGDWSDASELWDTRPEVTSEVNPVLETDSEFYISFDDLRHSFYQLYVVARGTGRSSSLRFLTQAAFTEPPELARQQGAALAVQRASTKRFYGVSSCLPRSRNLIHSLGAAAGTVINRVGGACASVSRKGTHVLASPAEAASSLDNARPARPAAGRPAAGGTVVGRPWAAVAALRSYLRPGAATATGQPAAGGAPAVPAAAAGGTVLGYAVWPTSRWTARPGPVTILRAYWRGEPLPTAAAATAAAAGGEAPGGGAAAPGAAPAASVPAAVGSAAAARAAAEGMPMVARPAAAAGAAAAAPAAANGGDVVDGVPPMPLPSLPVTRPSNISAPAPAGAEWHPNTKKEEQEEEASAAGDEASGSGAGGSAAPAARPAFDAKAALKTAQEGHAALAAKLRSASVADDAPPQ